MPAERDLVARSRGSEEGPAGEGSRTVSHLRDPLGLECTSGEYRFQGKYRAQKVKEGVGAWQGPQGMLMSNRNRGNR